jgi:6-phosphofructokinase
MIRAIPTTSNDRIYCKILAHNAVHAAFAGEALGSTATAAWEGIGQGCRLRLSRQ